MNCVKVVLFGYYGRVGVARCATRPGISRRILFTRLNSNPSAGGAARHPYAL